MSVREVLTRHPWANGLMDSGTNPGPSTLRHHDRVLGTFRNGGFSLAMTAHAFSALDSYIYGFAKQEKALPFDTAEQAAAMAQIMLAHLPPTEYPYLFELTAKHVLQPGYSYANEFTFGLDPVLDALDKARDSEASSSAEWLAATSGVHAAFTSRLRVSYCAGVCDHPDWLQIRRKKYFPRSSPPDNSAGQRPIKECRATPLEPPLSASPGLARTRKPVPIECLEHPAQKRDHHDQAPIGCRPGNYRLRPGHR